MKDLLLLDTPTLEQYLIRAGGLAGASPAAAVAALAPAQVAHVEVLARLYISRGEYAQAAQVYEILADRQAGPGEGAPEPSLEARVSYYQAAVLQVRGSTGQGGLLAKTELRLLI